VSRIPKKPLSEIDLSTVSEFVLTATEEECLSRGITLFNAGRFWEAHEAWEEIWQGRPEDSRFFIQGLIQLAAAYHQLGKSIYRGAMIHLKQAEERLKLFPVDFLGLNVAGLLEAIRACVRHLESQSHRDVADPSGMIIPRISRS
jgi:predicted metal-dependent hydrolase